MPRRSILLFAGACAALAVAVAIATVFMLSRGGPAVAQPGSVTSYGEAKVGGPFQLVNQDGQPVDQSVLNGKWSVVFFGFTYCPDFCPGTLQMLEAAKRELGPQADDLQIVFVTVDPQRDKPQALKDYLSADGFPQGVVGLTGTPEQVKAAADAYRAYYQKVGTGEDYTMNHSLTIYLMGPDGKFRSALTHDLGPQRGAQVIRNVMARG